MTPEQRELVVNLVDLFQAGRSATGTPELTAAVSAAMGEHANLTDSLATATDLAARLSEDAQKPVRPPATVTAWVDEFKASGYRKDRQLGKYGYAPRLAPGDRKFFRKVLWFMQATTCRFGWFLVRLSRV